MKQLSLTPVFYVAFGLDTYAQITTAGSEGRSKLIVTHDDGKQEAMDLPNLFNSLEINFKTSNPMIYKS